MNVTFSVAATQLYRYLHSGTYTLTDSGSEEEQIIRHVRKNVENPSEEDGQ